MSGQTKGPWKAHATGFARSGVPEFEIHWSDFGECVAEVVHGEDAARLIAAAPDLLNALRVLAFAAETRGIPVEAARAAIAKAEASK
jgi:hypothetical protein